MGGRLCLIESRRTSTKAIYRILYVRRQRRRGEKSHGLFLVNSISKNSCKRDAGVYALRASGRLAGLNARSAREHPCPGPARSPVARLLPPGWSKLGRPPRCTSASDNHSQKRFCIRNENLATESSCHTHGSHGCSQRLLSPPPAAQTPRTRAPIHRQLRARSSGRILLREGS